MIRARGSPETIGGVRLTLVTELKKDPGIPNLFPGKDKLLTAIQDFKAAAAVEKRNGPAHVVPPPSSGLADLRADAEKRGSTFDAVRIQIGLDTATYKSAGDAAVDGTKDNSFRAYKHHFAKLVSLSDVILFVLDARDPLGTRAKQVEETILNAGASKKIILVLNKIDLVPQDVVKKWLKYLREEFPTVGFKSSTKENSRIAHIKGDVSDISESALKTSEAVGLYSPPYPSFFLSFFYSYFSFFGQCVCSLSFTVFLPPTYPPPHLPHSLSPCLVNCNPPRPTYAHLRAHFQLPFRIPLPFPTKHHEELELSCVMNLHMIKAFLQPTICAWSFFKIKLLRTF